MTPFVVSLNHYLALGTIALQIGVVLLVIAFILKKTSIGSTAIALIERFAYPLTFLAALGATALTLLYSDYFGFIPCGLCWFQRIFLYPQIILLGVAWYRKDRNVWLYVIILSALGLLYALYNHYVQLGGSVHLPCPASGGDCGQRFMYEFDYVTFPLMSATLFAWQGLVAFIASRKK